MIRGKERKRKDEGSRKNGGIVRRNGKRAKVLFFDNFLSFKFLKK